MEAAGSSQRDYNQELDDRLIPHQQYSHGHDAYNGGDSCGAAGEEHDVESGGAACYNVGGG
jgi:hypothetical protein